MTLKPDEDYFRIVFEQFLPKFKKAVELEIQMGNNISIVNAKQEGQKIKQSPLTMSKKDLDLLTDKILLFVKGVNQDLSKQISVAVIENISSRGSNKDLAKVLKDLFDKNSSTYFDYKKRFETIARTESTFVLNNSSYNKAIRLGASKKYLSTSYDKRTSDVCKGMRSKYGEESQAIPIDHEFKVMVNGKEISALFPPFHPNCRSMVLYSWD